MQNSYVAITTNFLSALLLLLFLLFCVFNFNFYFYSSQLKKDIKMTNIEELQIQSETYYQEVNCDGVVYWQSKSSVRKQNLSAGRDSFNVILHNKLNCSRILIDSCNLLKDKRHHWRNFTLLSYYTNKFHVAVILFSNRSQKISKCGNNISDTLRRLLRLFFVLNPFWCHLWSIAKQTHGNMEPIFSLKRFQLVFLLYFHRFKDYNWL